jgi:hypothetical protein
MAALAKLFSRAEHGEPVAELRAFAKAGLELSPIANAKALS